MGAMQDLVVNLSARTAAFDSAMRGAMTMTNRFRGAVGGLGRGLMNMSGIAGMVSVGAIGMLVRKNLDLMDSTGELSDRLGISTERIQGLRHAAELAGTGSQALDSGLERMTRLLGEAAGGSTAATKTFRDLGLPIKTLLAMNPDERFAEIAERIKLLGNETLRASAAQDIFGKGGASMINMLILGKSGLARYQAEMEKLGGTFDRAAADRAGAANDALANLSTTIQGSLVGAVADLSDQIKDLADAMARMPGKARDFRVGILEATKPKGKTPFWRGLVDPTVAPAGAYGLYQDWRTGGEFSRQVESEQERLGKGSAADAPLRAKRRAAERFAKSEQARLAAEQKIRVSGAMGEIIRGPAATSFGWLNEMLGGAQGRIRGGVTAMHERQKELKRGRELGETLETAEETFFRKVEELERLLKAGAITEETFQRGIQKYDEESEPAGAEGKARPGTERRGDMFAGALERGSREAYSAILAAMGNQDPAKKTAEHTRQVAANTERIAGGIERIERKGADIVPIGV